MSRSLSFDPPPDVRPGEQDRSTLRKMGAVAMSAAIRSANQTPVVRLSINGSFHKTSGYNHLSRATLSGSGASNTQEPHRSVLARYRSLSARLNEQYPLGAKLRTWFQTVQLGKVPEQRNETRHGRRF